MARMRHAPILSRLALVVGGCALLARVAVGQGDGGWPSWRGPGGTGCAPGTPPLEWSETNNIKWKVPVAGLGISSPIVWGDRVYLTTAVETDRPGVPDGELEPQGDLAQPRPTVFFEFAVVALDRSDGRQVWRTVVAEAVPHEGGHSTNSHASNSPVVDGEHLFANFGSRGVYCLTLDGEIVWGKQLGRMRTRRQYGEASSPAVHGDKLIVNWDHEGDSFLAVFDKRDGTELWRAPREEVTSWSTPIVVPVDGREQIIINATGASRGYDLASGDVIWSLPGMTVNCIPTPIYSDGVVYLMSGYRGQMLQAVALAGARGELQGTEHVLWQHTRSTSYVPSAVLHDGALYFLRANNAVLSCLDAKTGGVHYEGQRLRGLRSVYASPVCAAGRIYITSREGVTMVLAAGSEFSQLALNPLDDAVDASLAIVGDEIYLRGREHMYCIAELGGPPAPAAPVAPSATRLRRTGSLGDAEARTASLSAGDLDGDGDVDLVVANGRHWPKHNEVFFNNGRGAFDARQQLGEIAATTYAVPLADMDGDGDLDAVVGNDRMPSHVYWNDGEGRFAMGRQVGEVASTRSVTLADLDGVDGVDVIFCNRGAANLICFNDGRGGFTRQATFGGSDHATITVAAGDLDGDGDLDLAVANRNGQQNFIYINDGAGGFEVSRPYGTGSDQTRGVAIADVDGDGRLDILNANIRQPNAIYFGDGQGGVARVVEFGDAAPSFALTTADLDGDGRLDILIANAGAQNAAYLQRPDGAFTRIPFGPEDDATYGIVAGDWDGDGLVEIATANSDGLNLLFEWVAAR